MGALPTLPTPQLCLVWAVITIIGEYNQLIIPFSSHPTLATRTFKRHLQHPASVLTSGQASKVTEPGK